MIVEYSGWTEQDGSFKHQYDVPNTGMVLIEEGKQYKQLEPFKLVERDWNNDDEIYTMRVAYFESEYGTEYYTAEDLVSLIVNDGIEVRGITKIN